MDLDINKKTGAAALSILSNSSLIIMKLIVGVISGSVSIISEAIHSAVDLLAAVIAFLSVKFSSKPADEEHPYGHGKIENISGFIEGILIFAAAVFIVYEAVKRILTPHPLLSTDIAIAVMFISAFINLLVSSKLYKVAYKEDSIALEADALHLRTDVYTSVGVGIGLILIKFTGFFILDPIIAILVALLIVKEAWKLTTRAFNPLLDSRLPQKEEEIIRGILEKHSGSYFEFTHLRTRKAGSQRFVDFHAKVSPEISVQKAYELNRHIKEEIEKQVSNVHIHIDIEIKEQ